MLDTYSQKNISQNMLNIISKIITLKKQIFYSNNQTHIRNEDINFEKKVEKFQLDS